MTHCPLSLLVAVTAGLLAPVTSQRACAGPPLPGSAPLDTPADYDFAMEMVAGIDRFLLENTAASVQSRAARWHRNRETAFLSEYQASVEPNRLRLAEIIGAVDQRVPAPQLVYCGDSLAISDTVTADLVRFDVFPGVEAEGILLQKLDDDAGPLYIVAPDADQTPEQLTGLAPGMEPAQQYPRRLAEAGCKVLVLSLVDRDDTHSVVGPDRKTNQPHREFIYRQAYELGRHVIGYEVQKILAAIDALTADNRTSVAGKPKPRVGVWGYGEGGLLALYAGALDRRIDVTVVGGYFDSRQELWQEPIYRNVWSLLDEFGDAEIASLIFPRKLIVEACAAPQVAGPPAPHDGRGGAAPGRVETPPQARVEAELQRARELLADLRLDDKPAFQLVASADGSGPAGCDAAIHAALNAIGQTDVGPPRDWHAPPKIAPVAALRQQRQVWQLVEHTQRLLREAEYNRRKLWAEANPASLPDYLAAASSLREVFYREVIGRFDRPRLAPSARTRQVFNEPAYTGYEVQLDVFPGVFAYGLLLVPKGIDEKERRPCVVCQHGLEGRPRDVADPAVNNKSYNQYACRLAERGFVVYAPQNPYIGQDKFRTLQRKANPLKKSLFSIIVPQHQAAVEWLAAQKFVDPGRIAFYGLSYGGKTAMRVPAIVTEYCLSICSADFNEWIWKNASSRSSYSYLATPEYEMFEFDLGNTFNYAEMAGLIAPRPFMVERGHDDGVAPDEWVAYEYAKVRRLYTKLKIPERTEIEFFDGPHTIHGVGTFGFLHRHLSWPAPPEGNPPLNEP